MNAISKATNYLRSHQLPNGEFSAYMSGDDDMKEWVQPMDMVFPTALICNSLLFCKDDPMVKEMFAKSKVFLRYQVGRGATWNHFTHFHPLRKVCPQDVDDTVCVSEFLATQDDDFSKEVNRQLICDNRAANGLFYTWFAFRFKPNRNLTYWRLALREFKYPLQSIAFWQHEASHNDIDAVVNANVLYYLGDVKETQPVIRYLLKIIAENKEADCDMWYRNPLSVYYFFSRNYYKGIGKLEPMRQPVIDRITAQTAFASPLDAALAACTLLNFSYKGPALDKAIEFLIDTQHQYGHWPRRILYYGGPKKLAGYGSEE
ncbi:MAG TPA: hypothetical protein VEB42_14275, partial [Chitinophagaceae bacterium]|nr:hypothetical protein [Chitinophagaceae bacterium]